MNTLKHWLDQAIPQLREHADIDTPVLDAQLLACHVLNISRSRLIAFPEQALSDSHQQLLGALLQRRINGEPLAYILGVKEFWSTELITAKGALVPRPDTEILVEKALDMVGQSPEGHIIDLGTGTGAIAIALALELPERQFIAIEKSADALKVALSNISRHVADSVQLVHGSWLDSIASNSVAMVLANPPYLASNDAHLEQLKHEPCEALVSGSSGLEDLEHIISSTIRVGRSGAPLIVEHGSAQGPAVRALLSSHAYLDIGTCVDLAGHERVSFGRVAKPFL